ncbi:MAG: polyprenol monophosphomannose synthase [Candidatus Magasanikbacteria bacterium]
MHPIIVIPTYNEKENIEELVKQIFDQSVKNLEIIVVDDNSPDGTATIVERLSDVLPITLVKRRDKMGIGSAYITGFKKALEMGASHIFEMDADFSHDPKDIPKLLDTCHDADVSIGSRKILGGKIIGWGPVREMMSGGAMLLSRILLGLEARDVTAGFRCLKKEVFEKIDLDVIKSNGYAFQEELLYRIQKAGCKIIEVPVTFIDRRKGKTKLSKKDVVDFFLTMIRLKMKK